MRVRHLMTSITAVAALLAGCGDGEATDADAAPSTPSASTSVASTSAATPSTDDGTAVAVELCTTGMTGPDALVSGAAHDAHDGTRSVSEIADAFREAQDATEVLVGRAQSAQLGRLAQALQTYADTLGRARVVGDIGLTEILDARQAVDVACYTPSAPATPAG